MYKLFTSRIYSLDINTYNRYSFVFFYVNNVKKEYYSTYNNINIKISIMYDKAMSKKGIIYILYSNTKKETLCLPILIDKVYNEEICTSMSYNSVLYNSIYYKSNNIKKILNNWVSYFNIYKHLNFTSIYTQYYKKNTVLYLLNSCYYYKVIMEYKLRNKIIFKL